MIGEALRSRTKGRQTTEVAIAVASLNRMLELGGRTTFALSEWTCAGADFAQLPIRATKCRPTAVPLTESCGNDGFRRIVGLREEAPMQFELPIIFHSDGVPLVGRFIRNNDRL